MSTDNYNSRLQRKTGGSSAGLVSGVAVAQDMDHIDGIENVYGPTQGHKGGQYQ